jgi:predicted lipoprotein with Yx(FWY)xxD motif
MNRLMISAFALILAASSALATPTMTAENAGGKMLTNADGMTLYTFDKDAEGVSNCAGDCATLWPVLAATADDKAEGDYAVIDRADGTKQWTYKGKPLYTFSKDAAAGDVAGDGVKGVWHIARP